MSHFAVAVAATPNDDEALMADACRAAEGRLLAKVGLRRVGPVSYSVFDAPAGILAAVELGLDDPELRTFIQGHMAGLVVMASVEVD